MLISNAPSSRRPSLTATVPVIIIPDVYSDSRNHGHQGSTKHARLPRATTVGGGSIAKCPDGERCVVAGKESLRILRMSEPSTEPSIPDHKFVIGRGGFRIDASRNMWKGSGLKIDSISTDVVWACGEFSNKILTSARNGELIMWDLNKTGPSKYERRTRDHVRSIHKIAYSPCLQQYCMTCSADGDLRIWDLRDLTKSVMKIRHPTSIRTAISSPLSSQPRQVFTGLDNGYIYRWDLHMGQRGALNRIPVAHNGPILAMDWSIPSSTFASRTASSQVQTSTWLAGMGTNFFDEIGSLTSGNPQIPGDREGAGLGWLATGGLDRCVKVWDVMSLGTEAHMPKAPTYTLQTSFPVRRVLWRIGPAYECELAIVSNAESSGSGPAESASPSVVPSPHMQLSLLPPDLKTLTSVIGAALDDKGGNSEGNESPPISLGKNALGDPVEIWDVRRGFIAKWRVRGSANEGGVTDIAFADSHTIWAEHASGSFSQFDLRQATRPLDTIPRVSTSWNTMGSMVFVADKRKQFEVPYDDIHPERRQIIVDRKGKVKGLGDIPYQPTSQTMGLLSGIGLDEDIEIFAKLAEGYVFEGVDRPSICAHNAEVALQVGNPQTAQAWLLLESLLTELVTPIQTAASTPALSPLPFNRSLVPDSPSTTAAMLHSPLASSVTTAYTQSYSSRKISGDTDPQYRARPEEGSPVSLSRPSLERITSGTTGYLSPQRITPTSSTTSSPHRTSLPLPAAILAKRGSISGVTSTPQTRPRLFSSSSSHRRRPSINASSLLSGSGVGPKSALLGTSFRDYSLKDVGDGALSDDDDDTDDGASEGGRSDGRSTEQGGNEGPFFSGNSQHTSVASGKGVSNIPISPFLYPHSRPSGSHLHPVPSPLSRVAGKHDWTEDEADEGDSPSPASTDESDSESSGRKFSSSVRKDIKGKGVQRSKARAKTKSITSPILSSTAALGPNLSLRPPKLTKQESSSSIRTVTAVNSPNPDAERVTHRDHEILERDYASNPNLGALYMGKTEPQKDSASFLSRGRLRSAYSAEFTHDTTGRLSRLSNWVERHSSMVTPVVKRKTVEGAQAKETENRLREVGWQAMRDSIDVYADEGDIQMCTMLSLVAAEELKISKSRLERFLEAYIDILVRLRLHSTAAYLRKYSPAEDVRNTTSLETTIYASCGNCGRPIIRPAAARPLTTTPVTSTAPLDDGGIVLRPRPKPKPNGSYGFCLSCRKTSTSCSICHLPVRALLFKCAVCMHGGHQSCFQNYYSRKPLVEVTVTQLPSQPPQATPRPSPRGRPSSRSGDTEWLEDVGPKDDEATGTRIVKSSSPILGHPCAAGCGHFCWATNEDFLPHVED